MFSVPKERLENLKTLLPAFKDKTFVSKNELARLIGILSWCCFGVRSGRTFLRRLIDLSKTMLYQTDVTRLDEDARSDIEWWIKFAPMYSGISLIIDPTWRGGIIFHTDSSGKSCAGVWGDRWFVYKFTALDNEYLTHISTKELFAVVMACRTYREGAKGKTIIAYVTMNHQ
jgi:hypothetical protein